jgi:hypothetical protein
MKGVTMKHTGFSLTWWSLLPPCCSPRKTANLSVKHTNRRKSMTSKIVRVSLLTIANVLAIGSVTWAKAAPATGCSDATLTGNYGILFTGTDDSSGNAVATVGQVTLDGKGKLVGVWTQNVQGEVADNVRLTGAYKVGTKCTGSATITPKGGTTGHFDIVVDTSGHRFEVIVTDSGQTQLGYALAEGSANCSKVGLTGSWGAQASGILLGIGPGAVIEHLNLNGNGTVSVTATESVAGDIIRTKLIGTYKISSNCRGTLTITNSQGTDHSNFVVVNGGQEVLMVGTDSALVVAGTAQR